MDPIAMLCLVILDSIGLRMTIRALDSSIRSIINLFVAHCGCIFYYVTFDISRNLLCNQMWTLGHLPFIRFGDFNCKWMPSVCPHFLSQKWGEEEYFLTPTLNIEPKNSSRMLISLHAKTPSRGKVFG